MYEIDRARVSRSGLVIAYAGTPSFGVGIEVEIAREHGIPVILVAERDRERAANHRSRGSFGLRVRRGRVHAQFGEPFAH